MLTVNITSKTGYAEESQPNPLRWYILDKTENGFQNVSAQIKCKDFFNDLAYTLQTGKKFSIYGFNAGNFNLDPKNPVWMLLTETTESFEHNFQVMNTWLKTQKAPQIPLEKTDKGWLVTFDLWYFKNVYRISLVSLIIRLMNVDKKFKDFIEVQAYGSFPPKDQTKWSVVVSKGVYFQVPAKLDKYLWYCGEQYNSATVKDGDYQVSSFVHNNGVLEWSRHL